MGLGLYFVFMRPSLLPKDPRFMRTKLADIKVTLPGLELWLQRVFRVMGGYMFATGLLTIFVALTSFRARIRGAVVVVAISGLTSIGLMVIVNFLIHSDSRRLLFSFVLPWSAAIALNAVKRKTHVMVSA